jgi:deazaflavin-dependent oxidoreductase (nitroreductase family)
MLGITEAAMYKKPDWLTQHIMNPLLSLGMKLGISMRGSRTLSVRGRKSGEWRSTPVNPLSFDGQRYLVAPRGETQWVRNIRVTGEGVLTLGRKKERISVQELPNDDAKIPILRAYLKHWAWETKTFFEVDNADVPDEKLREIAPLHPIFRIAA